MQKATQALAQGIEAGFRGIVGQNPYKPGTQAAREYAQGLLVGTHRRKAVDGQDFYDERVTLSRARRLQEMLLPRRRESALAQVAGA